MKESSQTELQSQPSGLVQNFFIVLPNTACTDEATVGVQAHTVLRAIQAALGAPGPLLRNPQPSKYRSKMSLAIRPKSNIPKCNGAGITAMICVRRVLAEFGV